MKLILLIILLFTIVFGDPVPIHVTKSLTGDLMIVTCEYLEKITLKNVYYVYSDRGEMIVHTMSGVYKFRESNVLWYSIEELD